MSEKLTRKQVVRALRRLNNGWPDDLWLFSAGGSLHLMRHDTDGERATLPDLSGHGGEGADPAYSVEVFEHIENDGGDW